MHFHSLLMRSLRDVDINKQMLSFLHKKVSLSADIADNFGCDCVIEKHADQSLSNIGD